MDSGKNVEVSLASFRHVNHCCAVTSHSSQGATTGGVLLHFNVEQSHRNLVNSRLGYVGLSRARHEAQVYTSNLPQFGQRLGQEVSKSAALTRDSSWVSSYGRGSGTGGVLEITIVRFLYIFLEAIPTFVNDHGKTWKFEHRPSLISSTRYSSPEAGDRVAVACILSEVPTICFCGVWAKNWSDRKEGP
jgi:hypothetical protein